MVLHRHLWGKTPVLKQALTHTLRVNGCLVSSGKVCRDQYFGDQFEARLEFQRCQTKSFGTLKVLQRKEIAGSSCYGPCS